MRRSLLSITGLARRMAKALTVSSVALACACGSSATAPAPPPCDDACKDGIAIRSVRETMKLVFNTTLQGKPVGAYDETTPCPLGGTARIVGTATSNALQGSTDVELAYEFADCAYTRKDDDPLQSYAVTLSGRVEQSGTLAVQPTATTSLILRASALGVRGQVHDPPSDFVAEDCEARLAQNGNQLSGSFCGREVGVSL